MREQTSVIVGPSGVGKSSLINALRGNKHILGAVEEGNWFDPVSLAFFHHFKLYYCFCLETFSLLFPFLYYD